jgi:hypothetical protein
VGSLICFRLNDSRRLFGKSTRVISDLDVKMAVRDKEEKKKGAADDVKLSEGWS